MSADGEGTIDDTIEAVEVRRNRWLMGLAASPLMLAAMLVVGSLIGSSLVLLILAPFIAMIGVRTLSLGWYANLYPSRRPVRLRADRDGLTIVDGISGAVRHVARSEMVRGVRTTGFGDTAVRIARRYALPLTLEVKRAIEPPLLTRLGLDVRQTTASFRARSWIHAQSWMMGAAAVTAVTMCVALAAVAVLLTPAILLLVPIVLFTPLLLAAVPSRVEVGADGALCSWLFIRRFVGYHELAGASVTVRGRRWHDATVVTLTTRSGAAIHVPIDGANQWSDDADVLCTRILDARSAWQAGNGGPPMPLLRGERDHLAWVAALRRQEGADLRSTAVPRTELWRVVEDVAGAPIDRAAAALALGRELGEAERDRLTRAARATVAPELREALERAAIAEDDEVVQRLRALERR